MDKYYVNTEEDVINLWDDEKPLVKGDIIVHKPYEFAQLVGLFKKHHPQVELVPVSPGTDSYSINGYNTSAIKTIKNIFLE